MEVVDFAFKSYNVHQGTLSVADEDRQVNATQCFLESLKILIFCILDYDSMVGLENVDKFSLVGITPDSEMHLKCM